MIEQLKIRNWLQGQATLEAWIEQLESQKASEEDINKLKEDAKTEGLGVAISNAKNLSLSLAAQQFINQQAYDIYRQGEYQYVSAPNNNKGKNNPFAGVSAGGGVGSSAGGSKPLASLASDDPPNLWERIVNWVDENIVQPVVNVYNQTVTGVKNFVSNAITWTNEHVVQPAVNVYNQTVTGVKNFVSNAITWTNEHVVQPAVNVYNQTVTTIQNFVTNTYHKVVNFVTHDVPLWVDNTLDKIYDYHGPIHPPSNVTGQIWSALPGVTSTSPNFIFNKYFVTQNPPNWLSPNECVTAATIQTMNMMQDILSSLYGIPSIPHRDLPSFAATDNFWQSWRPPADFPFFGGMLLPQRAAIVLNEHGNNLRETYGCGYTAELTSGNTVDDLIQNLQNGYPTNIHIARAVDIFDTNGHLAFLGGFPHTLTVVGYDANTDNWQLLDPAEPKGYTVWDTNKLLDNWGRKFLFLSAIYVNQPSIFDDNTYP